MALQIIKKAELYLVTIFPFLDLKRGYTRKKADIFPFSVATYPVFNFLKSIMGKSEECVKYVQS